MGTATESIGHISEAEYFAKCSVDEPVEEARQLIFDNAKMLLLRVNALLQALKWGPVKITSGYRSQAHNKKIGGAVASHHCYGRAVDIQDLNGDLYRAIASRPTLLKTFALWMEDGASTHGWVHLDIGTRHERPVRIFKP